MSIPSYNLTLQPNFQSKPILNHKLSLESQISYSITLLHEKSIKIEVRSKHYEVPLYSHLKPVKIGPPSILIRPLLVSFAKYNQNKPYIGKQNKFNNE